MCFYQGLTSKLSLAQMVKFLMVEPCYMLIIHSVINDIIKKKVWY
jgi:hypothetical protein